MISIAVESTCRKAQKGDDGASAPSKFATNENVARKPS